MQRVLRLTGTRRNGGSAGFGRARPLHPHLTLDGKAFKRIGSESSLYPDICLLTHATRVYLKAEFAETLCHGHTWGSWVV